MSIFHLPFSGNFVTTLGFGDLIPSQFGGGIQNGVDYATPLLTPILAAGPGVVTKILTGSTADYGAGNMVYITHANGIVTSYGHLASFNVKVGQEVQNGQLIAYSGNTGHYTTGPHLLFGATQNGKPLDPAVLFSDTFTGGGDSSSGGGGSSSGQPDQGFLGIPGAINDAAFTFSLFLVGIAIFIGGIMVMRTK